MTVNSNDEIVARLKEALHKIADLGSCGRATKPAHKLLQEAIDIATSALP